MIQDESDDKTNFIFVNLEISNVQACSAKFISLISRRGEIYLRKFIASAASMKYDRLHVLQCQLDILAVRSLADPDFWVRWIWISAYSLFAPTWEIWLEMVGN